MLSKVTRAGLLAVILAAATSGLANARSAFDGSWSLIIVTQRGACDATYYFQVQINNGIVSHPNLVRLRGRVAPGGAVHVSVATTGKFASGAGRLTQTSGRGRWSGHSGSDRCSGYWTAQRY